MGLYNRYGRLKTLMRRRLFPILRERMATVDPYLRSHEMALQKRLSWLMDQYGNPHESLHTMDEVLDWFDCSGVTFLRGFPSTVFGSSFDWDYRHTIFEPEKRGTRLDRLLSQLSQMISDTEGGLFIMIGRKDT